MTPDFNLLITLDALLEEGSVAGAARRLGLSASAMSRALARLRETTGDPLLVRAGRGLIPTPRAQILRDEVARLVQETRAVLRPQQEVDPASLERTFRLRSSDGFVEAVGPALLARLAVEAPGVRLHFLAKPDKESGPLRRGELDFETGVIGATTAPELRTQALFQDHFVAVVHPDHPLCDGTLTVARYAAARHVLVSRRGQPHSPIDEILAGQGRRAPSLPWSPGLRRRWPWSGRAIWWRRCRTCTAPACSAIWSPCPCPSLCQGSGSPCSGTPVRMPIRATAGCAP